MPYTSNSMFPMQCPGIPKTVADGRPPGGKYPSAYKSISDKYHFAMEQGRFLETSIGDVQKEAQIFKKNLEDRLKTWIRMQLNHLTAALPISVRPIKVVKDIVDIIKGIIDIVKEIQTTIQTLITIIQLLKAMVNKMIGQLQAIMNALANLMNEICNWNLPNLPSLPNIFGDLIWGFNSFQLSQLKLNKLSFDKNFAFGNCSIKTPDMNIFRDYPRTVQGQNGLVYGNQIFNPPLGGVLAPNVIDLTYTSRFLEPETYTSPILKHDFTTVDMNRAIPNPVSVLSNYHMSPQTYKDNIVCMFPAFDSVVVDPTNPTLPPSSLAPLYTTNICLEKIIDSNFDPNTVAAWVLYLSNSLAIRSGYWIPEFKSLYEEFIQPSLDYLNEENAPNIPYNFFNPSVITPGSNHMEPGLVGGDTVFFIPTDTNGGGVWSKTSTYPTGVVNPDNPTQILVSKNAPAALPFITMVKGASNQNNLLWRLTWLEAGLLGYHRSNRWDVYADDSFLSPITQTDLDYRLSTISSNTVSILLSSDGKAQYPPTITVPLSIIDAVQSAINKGEADIESHPSWRTSTQYRYIFDQFAKQHEIDRYSQFWREWASNFSLLLKAGMVTPYAVSYWQMIDSACNPLGDAQTNYHYLKYDAENRNETWVPGDGLPSVPVDNTPQTPPDPTDATNGWSGNELNDAQFLLRPDILSQPIPVQMAMMDLNRCYASLIARQEVVTASVNEQIFSAQATIDAMPIMIGFAAESSQHQPIPPATPINFSFDLPATLDMGNNYQPIDINGQPIIPTPSVWPIDNTSVKVPVTGAYTAMCYFPFQADTLPSVKKASIQVWRNGSLMTDLITTSNLTKDATSVSINQYVMLEAGDVVTFVLSHDSPSTILLDDGPIVSIMSANSTNSTPSSSPEGTTYPSGINGLFSGTAVAIDANGKLQKVDPNIMLTPTSNTPWLSGISLIGGDLNDSITLASAFGTSYSITGSNFTPGDTLYVQADGSISSVFPSTYYVIAVGKALTSESFIYQPQLPLHS